MFQTVLPSPETYCPVIMDMTYMWFTRYDDVQILKRCRHTYMYVPLLKLHISCYKSSIAIKAVKCTFIALSVLYGKDSDADWCSKT